MSDSDYRIRVRKGDYEVEVQGDKSWVESKFKELSDTVIQGGPSLGPIGGLPSSLAEFLAQKSNPTQHNALVVIFGYWLFHKLNVRTFNKRDMERCYTDARIPESANTSQYLNQAQAGGYFRRIEERKDNLVTWTITPTGERYVEQMRP